jgi:hypothetical protein
MSTAGRGVPFHYGETLDRKEIEAGGRFRFLGDGEIGGKAHGLVFMQRILDERFPPGSHPVFDIEVPRMTVLTTDWFDRFMADNRLDIGQLSQQSDERIALAFQAGSLDPARVGELWSVAGAAHTPLAIRSSSLLEDRKFEPFAGIYETKMVPNNQPEDSVRFRRLVEAVKFVYGSTFLEAARDYRRATANPCESEKMAVIIQEVAGLRYRDRFYPAISGVGRSYNYYPFGHASPADGVVNLALGLGKAVVDGGSTWTFAPSFPRALPPHGGIGELMRQTQNTFWAVNMGKPPAHDPIRETEYLVESNIADAEEDGTLPLVASTYDVESDRLQSGCGAAGPRVLTFAPILQDDLVPLNDLVRDLLRLSEDAVGSEVEIEFAVSFPPAGRPRFAFLQVRPMVVRAQRVDISEAQMGHPSRLVASHRVLGNGVRQDLRHVVYVKPGAFDARHTPKIATEIGQVNRQLAEQGHLYLLIGFGRWGSSDPWLGIPVKWGQVSNARVIVEATLSQMNVDLSQGSHFFHDINAFEVGYFCVRHQDGAIDWKWLDSLPAVAETAFVRVVALDASLTVMMDGRVSKGVVLR